MAIVVSALVAGGAATVAARTAMDDLAQTPPQSTVKWNLEGASITSLIAQPSSDHPFILEFPRGFDASKVVIHSLAISSKGGAGGGSQCATGTLASNECVVGSVVDGVSATTLKVIVSAPGYGFERIDVPSLATHPGRIAIQLHRLGTVKLAGRIMPLDGGGTLAGTEIAVLYDWYDGLCRFFNIFDCFTPIGDQVAMIRVQPDLSFSVELPDFASDDGLGAGARRELRFFANNQAGDSIEFAPDGGHAQPIAHSYARIVLRPVKR